MNDDRDVVVFIPWIVVMWTYFTPVRLSRRKDSRANGCRYAHRSCPLVNAIPFIFSRGSELPLASLSPSSVLLNTMSTATTLVAIFDRNELWTDIFVFYGDVMNVGQPKSSFSSSRHGRIEEPKIMYVLKQNKHKEQQRSAVTQVEDFLVRKGTEQR